MLYSIEKPYLYNKEKTYFLCLSVCQSVRHHFVLTNKSSGQKTVATRFSVLKSNLFFKSSFENDFETAKPLRVVTTSFYKNKR